jgi:predicted transcriptional regulator
MTPNNHNDVQLTFRVPESVARRIDELAAFHGRARSAEIRWALQVHAARSTLRYLDTAEAAAELGDELEAARATVEADLRGFEAAAYRTERVLPVCMN